MNRLADFRLKLGDVVQAPLEVSQLPGVQYSHPHGDPGLFGPGSISWRVGEDWPSALVGGMSGLILGTLHPLVLAGTLDHSIFRTDPIGRLARTASFVMATAFGSTEVALGVVDYVNRLHSRISGTAPNGVEYSATDPGLAVWTHVTIYGGFLEGHLRYAPNPISGPEVDRYWDEVARVPEMLGATGVPRSRYEVDDYFRRVRPELSASRDALDSARWVLDGGKGDTPTVRDSAKALVDAWQQVLPPALQIDRRFLTPASAAAVRVAYAIFARTAVDLLPQWGREMLQLRRSRLAEPLTRAYFTSLRLAVPTLPRALRQAQARASAPPRSSEGEAKAS
ncbi:MAG TPA: oxygenase MpaB family protein [Actinomycetota bacterium]|nr:oxygenase MpaB family protein [Actinomycetota bacterium]